MFTSSLAIITDTLLFHYPADKVFFAAVQAVNSLPMFRVDMVDKEAGYIIVTTMPLSRRNTAVYTLKIIGIAPGRTNFLITYGEEPTYSRAMRKGKSIKRIINTISKYLD